MNKEQQAKLHDYISGLRDIAASKTFSVGAILVNDEDRASALVVIKEEKVAAVPYDGEHPDIVLKEILTFLERGEGIIVNVTEALPAKLLNALHSLSEGQWIAKLAGEETTVVDSASSSAWIVLLIDHAYYDDLSLQDVLASVCRL